MTFEDNRRALIGVQNPTPQFSSLAHLTKDDALLDYTNDHFMMSWSLIGQETQVVPFFIVDRMYLDKSQVNLNGTGDIWGYKSIFEDK